MIPRALQEDIMRDVARAPSVHNIQPGRWRFGADRVTLFRALDRALPVADPTGHDLAASLGASFEGMALALSTRGLRLGPPAAATETVPGHEAVVTAAITGGLAPDPLASFVPLRRSFRGRFEPATGDPASLARAIAAPDVVVAAGGATLGELAPLHDAATWHFESKPEYHAELWHWLRLRRSDPRYGRDGLNGECLALSGTEQWVAARLLAPRMFARLSTLGVGRHLVSEAAQVRSASAAVLFVPRRDLPAFDVGRRMYRLWLEITREAYHLAPMSASADHESTREALARRFAVSADRRIANVFRVGRIPAEKVAVSPRLPVSELLI